MALTPYAKDPDISYPRKAPFLDLQRQVDELFEELIYRRWPVRGPASWRPLLDLHETPEAFLIDVDLPGVAPDEVRIEVSERNLTIAGQRPVAPPEDAVSSRCERACGVFRRSVDLPRAVDPARVTAECRHGHYRIRLPKKQPGGTAAGEATISAVEAGCVIQITVRPSEGQ
jgi:HSP20 family protein